MARVDQLERTLRQIESWANAYPKETFADLSTQELVDIDLAIGKSMVIRMHGVWGRTILSGVRNIISDTGTNCVPTVQEKK